MSTKRRLTSKDATPSKKGPHGNRQCRWCREEVFPPKQTFCSDSCTHEWKLRSDTLYLRTQLFMRDKGVCKSCGTDTQAIRLMLYPLDSKLRVEVGAKYWIPPHNAEKLLLWEADHVLAVCNGGGLAGLDNYQTLCINCHRIKTQEDLRTRRTQDVAVQEEN